MGYHELAMRLRWDIEHANHLAGARLPPIKDLAEVYDATNTTTVRAMRILAAEGLVDVIRGVGTFFVGADPTHGTTVEQQVENHYRRLIARTPPGTPMPSIKAMTIAYHADVDTIRDIRHQLVEEKLIRPTRWGGHVRA